MYVVVNRISIDPAHAEEFGAAFGASMAHLEGVPGLRRSLLLAPRKEGLPFMSTMEFDTEADFHAWLKSDSFRISHDVAVDNEGLTGNEVELYDLHTAYDAG